MSANSPWSVKGIEPKTREAAKDLARREGLTLGEWLNRLIGDVDEDGDVVASRENSPAYTPQNGGPQGGAPNYAQEPVYAPQQGYAPQNNYAPQPVYPPQSYEQPLAPFPNANAPRPGNWPPRDSENSRLTAALEQLTRRLDASASPSFVPQAPTGPSFNEHASTISTGLIDRIEAGERRTETALGRVDASLSDVRQTQSALAERLRAMEANDPNHKSLAALRGLESALGRLSQQVFEADERTGALEDRIDQKLAEATAKLGADNDLSERVGEIESVTQQALETLDNSVGLIHQRLQSTENMASETSHRLADAMIDLSARITGVQQIQDDTTLANNVTILGERMDGMEDVTTQAIESVDKGLGLVSQRVAATEALAQATNERLVEALIDLSARLVQLENIDSQEEARELLSALEAKNKELTRRLETLDNKIDATRGELTHEVKTAIATGVDGRMAEIAKALADRLDVSERRNGEALERIGAEMARASISLDQRLREIEERGTVDIAGAMRNEMSQMGRAIDERMAQMERRDAAALDQAGGHLQQLAQTLTERLDASEARAQNGVNAVSSQMEQLAQRLQARQDETAQNLVARMEDGEARGQQSLQTSLNQIAQEIRAAEDRAKAVSAPLHRDFNSMIDRLDQVEANAQSAYAETMPYGDQVVALGGGHDFGSAHAFEAPTAPASDAFAFDAEPQYAPEPAVDPYAARRPGFGAPFPGTDTSGLSAPQYNEPSVPAGSGSSGFGSDFDEDPFSMETQGVGNQSAASQAPNAFDAFEGDMEDTWSEPSRTNARAGNDYLTNARNAASRAAQENAEVQKNSKKKSPPKVAGKSKAKAGSLAGVSLAGAKADKPKAKLSPVGIAAAAALVAATGLLAVQRLGGDDPQNEKPAALTPTTPAAPAPAPVAPPVDPAAQSEVPASPPAAVLPNAAPTPPVSEAATTATPVVKAITPAAPTAPPKAAAPTAPNLAPKTVVQVPVAKAQPVAPIYVPIPTKVVVPPPPKTVARPVPPPTRVTPPITQVAPPTAVRVPFGQTPPQAARPAAIPQIATPRAGAVPTAARPAAPVASQQGSVPTPRVAVAGTRPATPAAATPTPARQIAAVSPQSAPRAAATGGSARQLYDQAMAKQAAGDAAGAAALMRAAADTGDARSINRLAKMYERGEGVARDPAQARALTERAAARGSSQAMHNMGVYYAEGEGPARDMNKAAESFRRAAARGVADSQFNLGAMAEQGLGTARSEREAYYWYSVAGRSGDRDAAAKSRELGARLPAAEKAAEDQRAAQFRAQASGDD